MLRRLMLAGLVVAAVQPASADPGRGSAVQCYLWANSPTATLGTAYTPSNLYSYNAVGRYQANTVTRTSTGVYVVVCKGVGGGALFSKQDASVDGDAEGVSTERVRAEGEAAVEGMASGNWGAGGHVQVTAYGSSANHCKVSSWGTGGADFSATVRCFAPNGTPANDFFDLLFVW